MAGNDLNHSAADLEEVEYDSTSSRYDIDECLDCDNVVLALGLDDPPMFCHDKPKARVTDVKMSVKPPDVKQVLLQAFGLPKTASISACLSSGWPGCRRTRSPSPSDTIGVPSLGISIKTGVLTHWIWR